VIIVGLPDVDGNLIIVGRSTVLSRAEPESLGKVLRSLSNPHRWQSGSVWVTSVVTIRSTSLRSSPWLSLK